MTLQQYNMGPETLLRGTQRRPGLLDSFIRMDDNIPELQEARQLKAAIAANGAMFSREQQSVLSMVVDELFNKRVEYKTAMKQLEKQYEQMKHDNAPQDELTAVHNRIMALDAQQMAMKIAINSAYGALGNEGFRYYDPSIAEAITQSGQLAVQFIAHRVSEFLDNELGIVRGLDRWLYSDTDSCYFTLDDFVDKITQGNEDKYDRQKIVDVIDAYCKNKIEPFIAAKYQELADYMNAYQNKMNMKREAIADRGMFRAKKNYVLQVYDNEGVRYEKPKLKTMGVETARSTTPQFVKDALLESYREMLNGTNPKLLDKIAAFKLEYMKQPVDVIATPRGVNDMGKWIESDGSYKNRIPYHVRASHEFNRLIREAGLNDIPPIQNGDKVRIVAVVPRSPVDGNYIAYNGSQLPKELGLEQYVDRESLFVKTFLNPVESFTKHMGWKHIDEFLVDDFFS